MLDGQQKFQRSLSLKDKSKRGLGWTSATENSVLNEDTGPSALHPKLFANIPTKLRLVGKEKKNFSVVYG